MDGEHLVQTKEPSADLAVLDLAYFLKGQSWSWAENVHEQPHHKYSEW